MAISCRQLRFRRQLSHNPARYCEIATGAKRPRNDNSGGVTPQNPCATCCWPAWRSLSAATDAIGAHRFNSSLYRLQVPSRDCTFHTSFQFIFNIIYRHYNRNYFILLTHLLIPIKYLISFFPSKKSTPWNMFYTYFLQKVDNLYVYYVLICLLFNHCLVLCVRSLISNIFSISKS